jgi:hypothetical protein
MPKDFVDLFAPAMDAVIARAEALRDKLGREPTDDEFAVIVEEVDEEFSDAVDPTGESF